MKWFASIRLTVYCLLWLSVLTFWGTVYQKFHGLYMAQEVFFGSWFDVEGHKQTGYFLGHEAVRRLEEQMSLQDIALIEDVEAVFREVVKEIALESTS